jgi:hypothetical protein
MKVYRPKAKLAEAPDVSDPLQLVMNDYNSVDDERLQCSW